MGDHLLAYFTYFTFLPSDLMDIRFLVSQVLDDLSRRTRICLARDTRVGLLADALRFLTL
jgi:hypothetical protein